jgi:hypothetical protein
MTDQERDERMARITERIHELTNELLGLQARRGVLELSKRVNLDELGARLTQALNMRETDGGGFGFTCECDHTHDKTLKVLSDMGIPLEHAEPIVGRFALWGGCCDCEVILNVLPHAYEDDQDDDQGAADQAGSEENRP